MRTLGIETSSRRGSIALVENGCVVASTDYDECQAHAERMLPLVAAVMAQAGWARSTLDRVAVGVGPGSFTGLRVGIALGHGIALGTSTPLVGITSLEAMAYAVPATTPGFRCAILDARRDEVYLGAFSCERTIIQAPVVLSRPRAVELVATLNRLGALIAVGEAARGLDLPCGVLASPDCDLPHARSVALLAESIDPMMRPATPTYVREADAVLPALPTSPLARPRRDA